jgi:hypothetical protein
MNLKQYNSVKVKDPSSDGYSVRLHPRQSFQLILTQIFEDEEFEVQLISDFLVLEEYYSDKISCREVYCFAQKYDLEKWANISTVFLGNIILTIKPTEPGKKETETIRLCVYLNCTDKEKSHVVTVINPDNQVLKMEPNQIIHTVIFDQHHARWSLVGIENLGMSCARSETVFNDVANVYDPKALFCPEPRNVAKVINNELDNSHNDVALAELNNVRRAGGKEYHFFTHLDLGALKKAVASPNGNYPMGDMLFVCKGGDGDVLEERKLTLLMALKGSGKRITTAEFQAIRHHTRIWNTPFSSPTRQCVLSPGFNESVDLPTDADTLYVEIPQPSVYFNKEMKDAYWTSEINLDAKYGLTVRELAVRHVNGFAVQRFMVSGILANKPPGDLLFIGALRFSCKQIGRSTYLCYYKSISLSLWKVRGEVNDRRSPVEFSYTSTNRTAYQHPGWSVNNNHNHNQHQYQQQHASYEVELEQMHVGLDGIKCVPLHDIELTSRTQIGGYDLEDLMPRHKKKRDQDAGTASTASYSYRPHHPKAGLLARQTNAQAWQEEDLTNNWYNWFDLV